MYHAKVENRGDCRYFAKTRHSSFTLDTEGKEVNPIDALLASLCGCVGHYVRDYMIDSRISNSGFTVQANTDAAKNENRLEKINVRIDVTGQSLTEEQRSEMLKYVDRCKVVGIVKHNPGLTVEVRD